VMRASEMEEKRGMGGNGLNLSPEEKEKHVGFRTSV
jgi:hypothetical protein